MKTWRYFGLWLLTSSGYAADLNPLLLGHAPLAGIDAAPNSRWQLTSELGNTSLNQHNEREQFLVDAEIQRWTLSYQHQHNPGLQTQWTLPWLRVSGGIMDRYIEGWHRIFDFPNGNRSQRPSNQLAINYRRDGQSLYSIQRAQRGWGDIEWRIGRALGQGTLSDSWSLWFSAKLPTASHALLGSQASDYAITVMSAPWHHGRLSSSWQATYLYADRGTILPDQQRQHAVASQWDWRWQTTSTWQIWAQLSAHTALYRSDLRILGPSMQLHLGPSYQGRRWQWRVTISEDIATDTAPDFQLGLQITHRQAR